MCGNFLRLKTFNFPLNCFNVFSFYFIYTQSKKEQGDANPLNMKNLEGIYWVLVFGSGMALIHGIISWICFVLRKARSHRVIENKIKIK